MSSRSSDSGLGDTIISVPKIPTLESLVHNPAELDEQSQVDETHFKIRLANTEGWRSTASYLIERRYAWRGYKVSPVTETSPNLITLAAFDKERLVATITVGTDSSNGLVVEKLYPNEVRALRANGALLCEFTKLAVDNLVRSKLVLAAIFHIAYIHARYLRGATDLLIEVNPRHVKFYKAMLGFEILGPERIDPRINAPAVLMRLEFSYAGSQIERWGGRRELAAEIRTLYPLVFSTAEEKGIASRLHQME